MNESLFVDARYNGNFGIGRYSREVLPRLNLDSRPFTSRVKAGSALDAVNLARLRLPRKALLYSPGFGTGVSKCRQLLTLHDLTHLEVEDARRRRVNRLYYERVVLPVVRRMGVVLTGSENSRRWLSEWLDDDITIINCGTGCSEVFTPDGPAARFDRDYFLYVGNLMEHKNPELAFAAMRRFDDHLLVVVASDSEGVTRLAAKYDITDRVRVQSEIADERLAELYRGASALLFPSRFEGFGMPALEAIRSETNVVYCPEAGSVAEICAGTQFAVYDSRDAEEFAVAMEKALTAPFAGPAHRSEYEWPTIAAKVEAAIRDQLGAA